MAEERDLVLRISADAAQAKAEIDSLQKSEQGLVASTEAATTATAGSTSALQAQGDAADQSAGQVGDATDVLNDLGNTATVAQLAAAKLGTASSELGTTMVQTASAEAGAVIQADAHVVAFRAEAAAADGVVLALREARSAIAQLSASTALGAAEQSAAIGRVAQAWATLEVEMNAAGGGTAAQVAGMAALRVQLAGIVPQLQGASLAEAGLTENHKLQSLAASAAGKAIAGHELSVSKLATSLIKIAGPALGFVTVVALLPQVIKLVVDKTNEWSTKIGELLVGLDSQAGVIRKAGESTDDYQKRVNEAADANEDLDRAVAASRKGIIGVTADSAKLRAEWILHAEAMHQGSQSADKLAFAYKELGLKMVESLRFEDAKEGIESFIRQYDNELKKGENAARRFTDANKDHLLRLMEAYEDKGRAIPAALQKIADKYDVVTQKQKESIETAKLQLEAWESLTPKARALVEQSEKFLDIGIKTGEAFAHPKIVVESLIDSIKKLETEGIPQFQATLAAMGGSLDELTNKAGFANAAVSALFDPDSDLVSPSTTPGRVAR
jgi:hypothetical protein